MKKLFFLGACLVALASSPAVAQTGSPDLVLVRFSYTGTSNLRIIVTRAEGKSEVSVTKSSGTEKGEVAASEAMHNVLRQLYQEGYALTSTTAEAPGRFEWVLTKSH